MPNITPTLTPPEDFSVTVAAAQSNKVTNVSIGAGQIGVEQSLALQSNVKQLIIKTRGTGVIQFTFTSGQSGTSFLTIHGNAAATLTNLDFTGTTLYFQVDRVDTVEIMELY